MRNYRIWSIVLIIVFLFSSMGVLANGEEDNLEEARINGEKFGTAAGKLQGEDDFKKDLRSDWERDIDDRRIIERYGLSDESELYEIEFLKAFKDSYKRTYETAYGGAEKKEEEVNLSILPSLGVSLGMIYGEIAGFRDFEYGISSNWSRSIPRRSEIDNIFDLRKLPLVDRNTFIQEFTKNYQIGYENAYYKGHFGTEKDNKEKGRIDGTTFGTMVGKVFAIKDYHEGRNSNYNRDIPSESQIIKDYSLNKDNVDYSEGFINGFKNSYEESYKNSYREAKNNVILLEDSLAYENGNLVGQAKGKIQANMDHMEKKSNDWERSQALSSTIIYEYNLIYQTPKYSDSFINGYFDGYSNAYTETYKELSQVGAIGKTTSETIPISGAVVMSLDEAFRVEIDKGIYYKPVILTMDSLNDKNSIGDRYISASNFYRINVTNPSGSFAKDKKIKIAFEYYGEEDGGIYQLEDGKWTYLTSTIEDGEIATYVNPSTISSDGKIFGVLVDTKTTIFHDIRGHWAKDEITAYIRRGVINGYPDQKFKPDQYITRAEFLVLLSRLYEWYLPYDTSNNEFFKDYETLTEYNNKHISYSLSHEYIIGYPDKYFRPYNNISYKEVDIIMRRVLNDPSFKWEKYAEQMIYEKKVRSSSYDSYDNKITRAEFSYILYKLNEWKY